MNVIQRFLSGYSNWWFSPLPRSRVAWFKTIVYSFVFLDVLVLRPWVADNGMVSELLYRPLMIGRSLPLPVPTPLVVTVVKFALLAFAALALSGRLPRLAGIAVFLLYSEWMLIAFSYGKVDHDRFAFLVALAVLPTVGKTHWRDHSVDESSGWALHCVQAAVVATYFLATFAKFRFGGIDWVDGATLTRAVLRRGTFFADPLQDHWQILHVGQYLIVLFELGSPLMLMRNMIGRLYVWGAFFFHAVTFAAITILFWPHVVCLLSFLKLERLGSVRVTRRLKPVGAER
ncbi:MAG: MFS transporter permease [Actinomycetota bacterium]|nr:MFS transporter permease [Actinomycetota bacterium]